MAYFNFCYGIAKEDYGTFYVDSFKFKTNGHYIKKLFRREKTLTLLP